MNPLMKGQTPPSRNSNMSVKKKKKHNQNANSNPIIKMQETTQLNSGCLFSLYSWLILPLGKHSLS